MSKAKWIKKDQIKSKMYIYSTIILVNLIGLNFMFKSAVLLNLIFITTLILSVDIARRMYSKRKNESRGIIKEYDKQYDKQSDLEQLFSLIKRQYKINRRYIFASILGLVLAILVVSQIYLLNSSYNQASFDRYVNLVNPPTYEITLTGLEDGGIKDDWLNRVDQELQPLLENHGFSVKKIYSYIQVTASVIVGEEVSEEANIRFVNTFQFKTAQWRPEIFEFLREFPTFPQDLEFNPDEVLLIIPPSLKFGTHSYEISDFVINNTISVLTDRAVSDTLVPATFLNYTYEIDNYWRPSQEDILFLLDNNIGSKRDILYKGLYLPEGKGWDFYDEWSSMVNENERIALKPRNIIHLKTMIYTEIPFFDDVILEEYQAQIIRTQGPVKSWGNIWASNFNNLPSTEFNMLVTAFSPLDKSIRNYQDSIGALSEFLILISSPLIAIALYLVNFAVNMVQKRKENIISVMKSRGTSNSQLHMMLSAEILIGGFVASIVGMLFSIPWTSLSLRTTGFFEFDVVGTVALVIPYSWFSYVPIYGFLIAFDLHIMSIIKVDRITTDTEQNKINSDEKPLWQEMYLDVIFFIVGIVYWITLFSVQIGRKEVSDFLIYDIGPFILSIMMVSGPMVFQRFYYPIVSFVSSIIQFRGKGDMAYLTKRNVYLHRNSSSKLAALLTAGFILTILTLSVPHSFDAWALESAAYEQGAEIQIEGLSVEENDRWGYLDVPEIAVVSPFIKFELNLISPYQPDIGDIITRFTFLGVDTSTFGEVGYWNDYYSNFEFEEIIEEISKPRGIGMTVKTLEALGMELEGVLTLPLITSDMKTFELNVQTNFDYFPNLVTQEPVVSIYGQPEVDHLEMLMSLDTLLEILAYYQTFYTPLMYIKLADGISMAEGKDLLLEIFEDDKSVIITTIEDRFINLFNREQFQLINSTLEGFLIISVFIVLIAYAYFVFLNTKDRQAEMGLYRVLGMDKNQYRKLFITEGLFLIGITSVAGSLLGFVVSSNFFLVITENSRGNIPPIRFFLDLPLFGLFIAILLGLTIIASLVPAAILAKRESGNLLRSI